MSPSVVETLASKTLAGTVSSTVSSSPVNSIVNRTGKSPHTSARSENAAEALRFILDSKGFPESLEMIILSVGSRALHDMYYIPASEIPGV